MLQKQSLAQSSSASKPLPRLNFAAAQLNRDLTRGPAADAGCADPAAWTRRALRGPRRRPVAVRRRRGGGCLGPRERRSGQDNDAGADNYRGCRGEGQTFVTWQTYAVAISGALGMFVLQSSLNAGRLVASQPGITAADPVGQIRTSSLRASPCAAVALPRFCGRPAGTARACSWRHRSRAAERHGADISRCASK